MLILCFKLYSVILQIYENDILNTVIKKKEMANIILSEYSESLAMYCSSNFI